MRIHEFVTESIDVLRWTVVVYVIDEKETVIGGSNEKQHSSINKKKHF